MDSATLTSITGAGIPVFMILSSTHGIAVPGDQVWAGMQVLDGTQDLDGMLDSDGTGDSDGIMAGDGTMAGAGEAIMPTGVDTTMAMQ